MADYGNQLLRAFDKALAAQEPIAAANVARLRRVHPKKSPKELVKYLDRMYLTSVTMSGGAAGAGAVVPGLGVPAALADLAFFTEASVLYTLSLAEIYGLDTEDIERRRLLVLTVMVGESATGFLGKAVERTGKHWANKIVAAIPMETVKRVNKVLGPRFVTKYGTKQGVLVLGKQVPVGIGAALGAGGNHIVGRGVVTSARKIFGKAPDAWGRSHKDGPVDISGDVVSVHPFETIWSRIERHAGHEFQTIKALPFTYRMHGNAVLVSRGEATVNRSLTRANFERAYGLMPADGPSGLKGLQGQSYTWAILMDPRIRKSDW